MRLTGIVSEIPAERIDALEVIQAAGGSRSEARVFSKLFGIEQIAVLPHPQHLLPAFMRLLDALALRPDDMPIDTLVYVHALPVQPTADVGIAAALAARHPALGAVSRRYEISQHNCGGGFWGLQAIHRLFTARLAQRALLIVGDSLSAFPPGERYIPGCTILGDAFVAMLLDNRDDGMQLTSPWLEHRAEFWPGLFSESPQKNSFYQAHNEMIANALAGSGFSLASHTQLLPHNINRLTWLNYTRLYPEFTGRIDLGLLPDAGHCCAADPFLLLSRRLADARPLSAPLGLLSVGAGAFAGACSLLPDRQTVAG